MCLRSSSAPFWGADRKGPAWEDGRQWGYSLLEYSAGKRQKQHLHEHLGYIHQERHYFWLQSFLPPHVCSLRDQTDSYQSNMTCFFYWHNHVRFSYQTCRGHRSDQLSCLFSATWRKGKQQCRLLVKVSSQWRGMSRRAPTVKLPGNHILLVTVRYTLSDCEMNCRIVISLRPGSFLKLPNPWW